MYFVTSIFNDFLTNLAGFWPPSWPPEPTLFSKLASWPGIFLQSWSLPLALGFQVRVLGRLREQAFRIWILWSHLPSPQRRNARSVWIRRPRRGAWRPKWLSDFEKCYSQGPCAFRRCPALKKSAEPFGSLFHYFFAFHVSFPFCLSSGSYVP